MPEEEGSRGQRFGVRGLWVFVLRRSPWGAGRSQKALSISWGRATATRGVGGGSPIGDAFSRKNNPTNPDVGMCARQRAVPPARHIAAICSHLRAPSQPFIMRKTRDAAGPTSGFSFFLFFYVTFSISHGFFSTLFKAGVCLFVFKARVPIPASVRNLTGNNPCAQKCSSVPRRGNVCLSPPYNNPDGTQGHCSLRPASKESFGVRKLQPCGVGGMGEVGVGVVRSVQFGFWGWGVSFWKRAARRGQR